MCCLRPKPISHPEPPKLGVFLISCERATKTRPPTPRKTETSLSPSPHLSRSQRAWGQAVILEAEVAKGTGHGLGEMFRRVKHGWVGRFSFGEGTLFRLVEKRLV